MDLNFILTQITATQYFFILYSEGKERSLKCRKKINLFFLSISEFRECLLYIAQATTAVRVMENNDGKDMWRAKTDNFYLFSAIRFLNMAAVAPLCAQNWR